MLDQLTFLSEAVHASHSRSPENVSDWTIRAATSPLNSWRWLNEFAPAGWRGRMSPASCHLGLVTRQTRLSTKMENGLVQLTENGAPIFQKQAISTPSSSSFANAGIVDATGCLTLNLSEWPGSSGLSPNEGDVCSLSDILERIAVPSRYYLTPKACAGILRRADGRGKDLPEILSLALRAVASALAAPAKLAARILSSPSDLPSEGTTPPDQST